MDTCKHEKIVEDLNHIIIRCSGLNETRRRLICFTNNYICDKPVLQPLVTAYLYAADNENQVMQFILDCSVLPMVITAYRSMDQSSMNSCSELLVPGAELFTGID